MKPKIGQRWYWIFVRNEEIAEVYYALNDLFGLRTISRIKKSGYGGVGITFAVDISRFNGKELKYLRNQDKT